MHTKLVVAMYLMFLSNSESSKTFRICGPTKILSFNLTLLSLEIFLQKNSKPFEFYFAIAFTKFLINSDDIKTLSGFTKWICWIFFTPAAYEFFTAILLFHSAVQWCDCSTNFKTTVFCKTPLQFHQNSNSLKVHT